MNFKKKHILLSIILLTILLILNGCLTKQEKTEKISDVSINVYKDFIKVESNNNEIRFEVAKDLNGVEFEFGSILSKKEKGNFEFSKNTLHLFYEKNGKTRLMVAKKGKIGFKKGEFLYKFKNIKTTYRISDVDINKGNIIKVSSENIESGISIIDSLMNKDGYEEIIVHAKNINNVKILEFEIDFDPDIISIDESRGNDGIEFLNSLKNSQIISISSDNETGKIIISVTLTQEVNFNDEDIMKIYVLGKGKIGISKFEFVNDNATGEEKSSVINEAGEKINVNFYDGEIKLKSPVLLGDFNSDGIVDLNDIVLFAQYNGLEEGDKDYKEIYDISPAYNLFNKDGWEPIIDTGYSDGFINLKDFTTLSSNFDKSVPNNAPLSPVSLNPKDGEVSASIQPTLQWYSNDKDGDKLSYSLYFGESSSPTLIATIDFAGDKQTNYSYDLSQKYEKLDNNKTYYWQVLATDSRGATTLSDLFSFTTEGISNLKPVASDISSQEISEGATFTLYLPDYFTDPEGDTLTFGVGENSEVGEITDGATFIYAPNFDVVTTSEASKTFNVVIEAWDSEHINNPTQLIFSINVINKNRKPEVQIVSPSNGQKSIDTTKIEFKWDANDADNDNLSYVFYLGENKNNFNIINETNNSGNSDFSIDSNIATYTGTLAQGTTYYWKVVVNDGIDEVSSDIYSFTTKGFRDGGQKDKIDVNNPIRNGLAISSDGYLYFTSDYEEDKGKIYVYNAVDTTNKIDEKIIDSPITTIPTLDNDGTVYFATLEGKVYAYTFNGDVLTEKWQSIIGVPVYTSPAIDAEGRLYIGDSDGILHVLDITDGEEIETYVTGNKIKSSISIDNDGNIYFGSYDGNLYSLKWNNNTLKLRFSVELNSPIVVSPAIDNDNNKLYIATLEGKIYSINLDDGTENEITDTGDYIKISPVIGDNVYFVTTSGKIYKGSNKIRDFGEEITGIPAIGHDGSNNELLYIPVGGKIYALDASGNERWTFSTSSDNAIRGNIGISKDGSIYAGSTNGSLYVVYDSENLGIYAGKWPVFQKNSFHTGGNRPPIRPYGLSPENNKNSIDPETELDLQWNSKDYDGDNITYYIYKGESENNLTLLGSTTAYSTTLNSDKLKYTHTYYWKIEAVDSNNATTSSDILKFNTKMPIIAGSSSDIYSIDVSDKENPDKIKNATLSSTIINAMTFDGTYVYLATNDGLYTYDASPNNINSKSSDTKSAKNLIDLVKEGNYIYALSEDASKLIVYDVSDINNITAQSTASTDLTGAKAIDVEGNYAYIVVDSTTDSFVIYDISDPTNPTVKSSMTTNISTPTDIVINNDYAYISCDNDGIVVIDISNPGNPIYIDTFKYEDENTKAGKLYISGNRLYVINNDGQKGIAVINSTYPDNMTMERFIEVSSTGDLIDLYVNNNYIYVAAETDGLKIVDEAGEAVKGEYTGNSITVVAGIYVEE
ncbi:outer membrane protein assembly factor BamB family protein [Marinitoga sp. 1155]|uniref:outer membrane protein assembly factor BamB family protein n=1 Tax=Marinitoga sp. 1155 TaxID=1428448 RepID=UPI0006592556|nr:PQQ-binding-like beta-propeller repeat protein [Marinitoga sp. 1155]KLO23028.1 hypothetical protein X274_07160 [Marinitoga sp. 1155]